MRSFECVVYGNARPQGSKRALPRGGKPGARPLMVDSSKGLGPWKKQVAQVAGELLGPDWELLDGALSASMTFYRPRPKAHYGTGKNADKLKPSAPPYPTPKPDVLKLARAVEDALTGIVYRDDSQLVTCNYAKRYGTPERVEIAVGRQP